MYIYICIHYIYKYTHLQNTLSLSPHWPSRRVNITYSIQYSLAIFFEVATC